MLRIEMLPAGHGDCLWLEYASPGGEVNRVLIDGGTGATYERLRRRILSLPPVSRRIELLVITHIDADHIGGIVKLLGDQSLGLEIGDVWFNGYAHLQAALETAPDGRRPRGALQAEALSALLKERGVRWNAAFGGGFVAVPNQGQLPERTLDGGLKITLLSPTVKELVELIPRWDREVLKAGLVPGFGTRGPAEDIAAAEAEAARLIARAPVDLRTIDPRALADTVSRPDAGEPNGSSIAFLAEFGARSILLTGDAFASTLTESVQRLSAARMRDSLRVNAFKLPHHGSQGNVTRPLLAQIRCSRYLVSTNGALFGHPDPEAIARVVVDGGKKKTLVFNYRTAFNEVWGDQKTLQEAFGYGTLYPERDSAGIRLVL